MFVWIVAAGLVVSAPALKDERKPVDPPTGEWVQWRLEGDGARFSADALPTLWRFTSKSVSLYDSDVSAVTRQAAFYRRGRTLELDLAGGRLKCIWKIDGNRLTICRGQDDGPRPTDFTAPAGSGRLLITLRRVPE